MGPPGAGKGTQAQLVSTALGVPHISTGDLFRANVGGGTALGIEAKRYMDAGEYVPDSVTNEMVRDRIAHEDCAVGFLLDGYPRTVEQVAELDSMLAESGQQIDRVVELTVVTDVVVERLLLRAQTSGRSDDTEVVIRRRLEVYTDQTAPLTALYVDRGLLVQVDGMGEIDEVSARVLAVLR
jgi:adenylate kinase